ncbi:MAG: hypothetical protein KJZ58_00515 [Flavobacteriales bacterium]|nr:hypothetical protein [Flavobacteriales bacterium]
MASKAPKDTDDVELSRAEFHIEGNFSDPDELEKIAWEAFYALRVSAYERYEDRDVGLKVHVEEGSAIGVALVLATAKIVYEAVAQYPDFKNGVKELANDGKHVAKKVLSIAFVRKAKQAGKVLSVHADAGAVGQVEGLFKRVRNGKMTRVQGEELALELLGRYGTIPKDTREAIQKAFRTMKVAGIQTRIPDEEPIEQQKRKRVPKVRESRERKSEWSVDIESRNRKDKPRVSRRRT